MPTTPADAASETLIAADLRRNEKKRLAGRLRLSGKPTPSEREVVDSERQLREVREGPARELRELPHPWVPRYPFTP